MSNFSQLFSRARASVRSRLGLPPPLVRKQIFGRAFVVRESSVRDTPDYDDAWRLACALRAEIIFDVGANVGQAALTELQSRKLKLLVLIEANPEALSIAAENLIRNHLSTNVFFVPCFIGEVNHSTVKFWTTGTGQAGSIYRDHARSAVAAGHFADVPTMTLDYLSELYAVAPDLVKIDVEGAEHKVLLGSKRFAANHKTRFLVEMHSNAELPMAFNAANVLSWCEELGYAAFYLAEGVALKTPAQIERRGRCHVLLQPADWPYPEWLKCIRQSDSLEAALAGADIRG